MKKVCPWFGICGGCKFDFTSDDYRQKKLELIKDIPLTDSPIWIDAGVRRRADFAFSENKFGFYQHATKDIINVQHCPGLAAEINEILPDLIKLPWCGSGSCLVTLCDNGIDICITSHIPYTTSDFKKAVELLPIIRATWNNKILVQKQIPLVTFGNHTVEYPSGAFLQPSILGADTLRNLTTEYAKNFNKIADLFCGLGNFTFALNADGFDVVGTGVKRDLFKKPLTQGMLKKYDCVVMDPPRSGAAAQCMELTKSDVKRIIYISCNPGTFMRDIKILTSGGYKINTIIPVDQFAGSHHWELFSVLDK